MYIWLILAFLFTALEAVAVSKNVRRVEYIAKPAVMICLFLWLYSSTGLRGNALWFGLGILLSLAGDVLLLFPADRMFLLGLVAFLLAHLFYIAGFREALMTIQVWSLILAVFIMSNAGGLLRRIVAAMRAKGENKLVLPVILYGIVISLMLFAAMSTLYNSAWGINAAFYVSAGAFLFWISDLMLAWDKFVAPIKNGRIISGAMYYLGQVGIVAGVISQFGM